MLRRSRLSQWSDPELPGSGKPSLRAAALDEGGGGVSSMSAKPEVQSTCRCADLLAQRTARASHSGRQTGFRAPRLRSV